MTDSLFFFSSKDVSHRLRMILCAQFDFMSSYRPKGSQLPVDPGAACCLAEFPRPAQECSQHSPICSVNEYKGQPGDITAAL